MRQTTKAIAVAALAVATCWTSASQAGFFSYPRALGVQLNQMNLGKPTLAPMAHTEFCLRYKEDCEASVGDSGKRDIAMTVERVNELNSVNRQVNREITPQPNLGGVATETWVVSPRAGECHDYAVTKRHELLARGWPSSALLLAEVVVPSGEHHLVLVVRMNDPDTAGQVVNLVLDSLNYNLRPVGQTPYQWVRMESPDNPKFWSTVSVSSGVHSVTLAD
jgi:predicted transglutaminase-like cysteine proteinase